MKLAAALLSALSGVTEASHFRSVTYSILQNDNRLEILRSIAWRRELAGYGAGCTATDVANQTPSFPPLEGPERCRLLSSDDPFSCGYLNSTYIVTDIEDTQDDANNYCAGSRPESFSRPTGPFEIKWESCCWAPFVDDFGDIQQGDDDDVFEERTDWYSFIATMNDPNNNSPQVGVASLWKIMAGCSGQTLELNPVDMDGDAVKCRWANADEARGALHTSNYDSLSLNEDTCVLTFDGTKDAGVTGVKPIAIQIEDFDENGNMKSSMPLQFLAMVWTPELGVRNSARTDISSIFQMPTFFPEGDEHDHEDHKNMKKPGRGRRSQPDYCEAKPEWISAPDAGAEILVPETGIVIELEAQAQIGTLSRFQYTSPLGMVCSEATTGAIGVASCLFIPTDAQKRTPQNFCFLAEDSNGLTTERRCVTLSTSTDVDECELGTHNCHSAATCTNNVGSFHCHCNDGWEGNGVRCTEIDIDECALGTHNCHYDATCKNNVGSFECQCNDGWEGNGVSCTVQSQICENRFAPNGLKRGCDAPICFVYDVDYNVIDHWRKKHGKKFRYGWNVRVDVTGRNKSNKNGWQMLIRLKGTQGDIQVWNANVRNVYRHEGDGYIDFLFHQKYWLKNDLFDEESFTFVIDRVTDDRYPEIFFWEYRSWGDFNKCFNGKTRSVAVFQEAIQQKERVNTYEDVSKVVVRKTGEMRVDI